MSASVFVSFMESVERLTSDFHKCHVLTFYKDIFSSVCAFFSGCFTAAVVIAAVTAMAVVSGFVIPRFSR